MLHVGVKSLASRVFCKGPKEVQVTGHEIGTVARVADNLSQRRTQSQFRPSGRGLALSCKMTTVRRGNPDVCDDWRATGSQVNHNNAHQRQ